MKKSKSFVFDVDVYNAKIHVLYLLSDTEINEYFNKHFPGLRHERDSRLCARAFAVGTQNYSEYVIDLILPAKEKFQLYDTIAHESDHILNYIFEDRNIFRDTKNPEPAAYLLGFIVRKIIEGIFKK